MGQTKILLVSSVVPITPGLCPAGRDCQSLLEDGPSRRYLCNPCIGAWTLTPRCFSGAHARFFPKNIGLTLELRRSAHPDYPCNATSTRQDFRGCSSASGGFRLPYLLDLQVAPTAEAQSLQGGQAVYTTQWTCGYPTRTVVSLHILHESA